MSRNQVIENTISFVKEKLQNEASGHDWFHIERVWKNTKVIGQKENVDLFICEMAALLHDLIDDKLFSDVEKAKQEITDWLVSQKLKEDEVSHILEIITTISFKGGNNAPVTTKEAEVVQDADRLDAIGAIGIARCFTYAGNKGIPIYDPSISVRNDLTVKEYREGQSTAINHFYEKLLKLKDLMNTLTGKQLAEKRHAFMKQFLNEFFREVK